MNDVTFTPAEIKAASQLAKIATMLEQIGDPGLAVQSVSGDQSYVNMDPHNQITSSNAPAYPQPTLGQSLGRSARGLVNRAGWGHLRSFFAGAPGQPSGLMTTANLGKDYMVGLLTGNRELQNNWRGKLIPGLVNPARHVQRLNEPYLQALPEWGRTNVMPTVRQVQKWIKEPTRVASPPPETPVRAPWEPVRLPPVKTTPAP